jgi:rubredoxin
MIKPNTPPKKPVIVALLNLFLVVGGYIYIGQIAKSIFVMLASVFLIFSTSNPGEPLSGIVILVPIFTFIDSYLLALKLKTGQTIKEWEFCWNRKMQPGSARKTGRIATNHKRYWKCPNCGSILDKGIDYEIKQAMFISSTNIGGGITCGNCQYMYSPRNVYSGQYDIY